MTHADMIRQNGGEIMNCRDCIYGDISNEPREIRQGNITIIQNNGGINCTCRHVKSITITGRDMVCSEFKERTCE